MCDGPRVSQPPSSRTVSPAQSSHSIDYRPRCPRLQPFSSVSSTFRKRQTPRHPDRWIRFAFFGPEPHDQQVFRSPDKDIGFEQALAAARLFFEGTLNFFFKRLTASKAIRHSNTNQGSSRMAFMHSCSGRASRTPTHSLPAYRIA